MFVFGIAVLLAALAFAALLYVKWRLDRPPTEDEFETSIDREVAKLLDRSDTQRIAVAVYKKGAVFFKGYGATGRESLAAPNAETIFQLGSVSKVFTASLLQILSEEGVVSLDATLAEALGERIALAPAVRNITLRQLATHTSGFPRVPKPLMAKAIDRVGKRNLMKDPYASIDAQDIFAYLGGNEVNPRASRFRYSNFGMGLLGHVLEAITGKTLDRLAAEKLFGPLGMSDTAIALTPSMSQRLIPGYTANGAATPLWTFQALAGAGAFNSNARDMIQFIRANLESGHPLSETLKRQHEAQAGGKTGLGWMQPTLLDGFLGNKCLVWHDGMVGGYSSYVGIDTHDAFGVLVLSNHAISVTMLGMMLMRHLRRQSRTPRPKLTPTNPNETA